MHEKIKIAWHPMVCDVCGQMIRTGERYRTVRAEYTLTEYREHIRCPVAPAVAITDPRPTPPKVKTFFNHAFA